MALILVSMLLAAPLAAQVTVDDLATAQGPASSSGTERATAGRASVTTIPGSYPVRRRLRGRG